MTVYIIPTCGMEATICRGCQTPIRFRKGKRRANDYTVARRRVTRWIRPSCWRSCADASGFSPRF